MASPKFCPKCGKETEELHDGLCRDCFRGKIEVPKDLPEKIKINTCKSCGNIFIKKERYSSVELAIQEYLRKTLEKKKIKTAPETKSANYRITDSTLFIDLRMESETVQKETSREIPLIFKTIKCEFCNLKSGNYYNVTIQVRVPKDMLDTIVGEIESSINKRNKIDKYSFISGMKIKKEGIDILVGSKGAVSHVVKYLKLKYHVKTKMSHTLFGLVQGKKTYRDTILVSLKEDD